MRMWSSTTSAINPLMAPRAAVSSRITSLQAWSLSRARSSASIWPRRRLTRLSSFCLPSTTWVTGRPLYPWGYLNKQGPMPVQATIAAPKTFSWMAGRSKELRPREGALLKRFVWAIVGTLLSAAMGNFAAAQPVAPWMNRSLSADDRAELMASQMSQDEELTLVKGYFGADLKLSFIKRPPASVLPLLPGTAGYVLGIPRLGIPPLIESDAGVGIANSMHMRPGDTASAMPST